MTILSSSFTNPNTVVRSHSYLIHPMLSKISGNKPNSYPCQHNGTTRTSSTHVTGSCLLTTLTITDPKLPPAETYVPYLNTLTIPFEPTLRFAACTSKDSHQPCPPCYSQLLLASYTYPRSYGIRQSSHLPSYPPITSDPTLHLISRHFCCNTFPTHLITTVPKPLAYRTYHLTFPRIQLFAISNEFCVTLHS